jgi:hypothetical protein
LCLRVSGFGFVGFFCSNVSVEDAIEVLAKSLVHKVGWMWEELCGIFATNRQKGFKEEFTSEARECQEVFSSEWVCVRVRMHALHTGYHSAFDCQA